MNDNDLDLIFSEAKQEISKKIDKFKAELDAGTADAEHFMTLSDIERKWAELKNETSKTYSDIVAAYLSQIDEKAVIRSKKENTGKRG